MEEKQFLIFLHLSDNHLSNVRSLQSIYRQNYPNIYLIACNDATDEFQCERFLYNFEAGRGENIKGVYLFESKYPTGECNIQKKLWNMTEAAYVIAIHSGEYFATSDVLSKCAKIMDADESVDAVSMKIELWSNDLKKCLLKYSSFDKADDGFRKVCDKTNLYSDCMFAYRKAAIEKYFMEYEMSQRLNQSWIISLQAKGIKISMQPFSSCKYSGESVKNVEGFVPKLFGNERIQRIYKLLKSVSEK